MDDQTKQLMTIDLILRLVDLHNVSKELLIEKLKRSIHRETPTPVPAAIQRRASAPTVISKIELIKATIPSQETRDTIKDIDPPFSTVPLSKPKVVSEYPSQGRYKLNEGTQLTEFPDVPMPQTERELRVRQCVQDLRMMLDDGVFRTGDMMPGLQFFESRLRYGTGVINRALAELVEEGRLRNARNWFMVCR